MAITKTTELKKVDIIFPRGVTDKTEAGLHITMRDTWDDPDDAELPFVKQRIDAVGPGEDVSGYPQFVQDLAAWLWS
jgi:hypothetical protein